MSEICASEITAPSTHPPETDPEISPLSLTNSIEPTGLGALFQVSTTSTNAKFSFAKRYSLIFSMIFLSEDIKTHIKYRIFFMVY